MGISLDYTFKYYVRLYSQFVIDLVVCFGLPEDVKPFQDVHHSVFTCCVEGFYNVVHWADGVLVF